MVNRKNIRRQQRESVSPLQKLTILQSTKDEFSVTDTCGGASGDLRMQKKKLLQLALAGTVCAVALSAADAWKGKDYTQWSDDEIYKVLNESPWAKVVTVTPQQSGAGQRRGGGMGRHSGGLGGGAIRVVAIRAGRLSGWWGRLSGWGRMGAYPSGRIASASR